MSPDTVCSVSFFSLLSLSFGYGRNSFRISAGLVYSPPRMIVETTDGPYLEARDIWAGLAQERLREYFDHLQA